MFTSPVYSCKSIRVYGVAFVVAVVSGCNYSPVYKGEFIEVNAKELGPYWVADPDTVKFQATQKEIKAIFAGGGYTKGVVWIDSNGKVTEVQITESEPPGVFDRATLRNQTRRNYSPGPENPERRPAKVSFETPFELAEQAQKELQGTWSATKAERDGKAADDVVGHRLSFAGDRFEIRSGDGQPLNEGIFRLEPDTMPEAIDFEHTEGNLEGKAWKGIYSLDGDTLTICDNAPNLDKGRPVGFEACTGSGYILITFERAEP